MKRFLCCLALLSLLAIVPSIAQAEGVNGFYVAPKFLMSITNNAYSGSKSLSGMSSDSYSQFTLGGGLAIGYDFFPKQNLPIRAELELLFRGNQSDTMLSMNDSGSKDDGHGSGEFKGTWNTTTLLANFYYDFHNSTAFTPYIMAGAGLAFQYAGYTANFTGETADKEAVSFNKSTQNYATNFAWNVGAGCSYAFSENFSLDLGYRFLSAGTNTVDGSVEGMKYEIDNFTTAHEFTLGARFTF